MKLTMQQLANLCNYSWEVERDFGFHMSPDAFKRYVERCDMSSLRTTLESLSELFRTVRDIGCAEIELSAHTESDIPRAVLFGKQTPTAAAAGVEEYAPGTTSSE